MLRLGKRKPWPEALKLLTGSDKLSAAPIKEYFQLLMTWLQKERKEKNYSVGWIKAKPTPKPSSAMKTQIGEYVFIGVSIFLAILLL